MMNYKKTYKPAIGYTKLCEIGKCSCKRLEFGMIELNAGDSVSVAAVATDALKATANASAAGGYEGKRGQNFRCFGFI